MVNRPGLVGRTTRQVGAGIGLVGGGRPRRQVALGAAVALVAGVLGYPLVSGSPASAVGGSLPAGTGIAVSVDSPADGTVLPPGPVTLSGTASLERGVGVPNTAVIYAFDATVGINNDAGPFFDFCSGQNRILDCERNYAEELNQAAIDGGAVPVIGAEAYGETTVDADLGAPGGGDGDGGTVQPLIPPDQDANSDGQRDFNQAAGSLFTLDPVNGGRDGFRGGFDLFQREDVSANVFPNLAPALHEALSLARQSGQPNAIIVILSDGAVGDADAAQAAVNEVPANVHLWPVSIGKNAKCAPTFRLWADRTGGICVTPKNRFGDDGNVLGLGPMPDILRNLLASHLDGLTVSVDGGAARPIPAGDISPSLPLRGPATVSYRTTLNDVPPGRHSICVSAQGHDSGGPGSVSDCRTVVLDAPPTPDPGGPYTGLQDAQIPIAGKVSDPDTENVGTQWTIHGNPGVDNDAVCTFGDANALSTTVSCNSPGTYALTLTANDGAAQPVSAGTTVTITNVPPTVSAGGPYTGTAGLPVPLTGTVTDPDSPGLVTTWSVTPPPGADPPADGSTTDGSTTDGSSTDGTSTDGTAGDPAGPEPCTFTDPTALSTSINCPTPGTYTLTLTVNDGDNTPVTATTTLTVVPAHVPVGSLSLGAQIAPQVAYVGGDPVAVTYTVRNDGELAMAGIRLRTNLPAALANGAGPAVLTPAGGPACLAGTDCDLGTLQPRQRRTVRFLLRPGTKLDTRIDATLTTTGADSNGADNKASVRVLVRQPQLVVDPTTGPPGLVVHASGQDFPAGAILRLTWSAGATQPGQVTVGRDGTFSSQVLVFKGDVDGPRVLTATIVRGPRLGPVESNSFLVAKRGQEPPFNDR